MPQGENSQGNLHQPLTPYYGFHLSPSLLPALASGKNLETSVNQKWTRTGALGIQAESLLPSKNMLILKTRGE